MLRAAPGVVALAILAAGGRNTVVAGDGKAPGPVGATIGAEPTGSPDPGDEAEAEDTEETTPDDAWVDSELVAIPEQDGVPLDVIYPVLAAWVHPVADSKELVPVRRQRKFGAPRQGGGANHRGCRRRHCGLDLAGPRGRTIVAVMDGVVKHIERRRMGKDGFSGRYVRIAHDGGVFTAYMHLDSIAPGLDVGDPITAGQYVGRLGRSGIRNGEPHLHFNLELPGDDGSTEWDHTKLIDSTPFLQRARVIADPVPLKKPGKRPQT